MQPAPTEQDILSALPVALVVLDSDGIIQSVMAGAEELFMKGHNSLIGQSVHSLPSLGETLGELLGKFTGGTLHVTDVPVIPALVDVDSVDISVTRLADRAETLLTLHPRRLSRFMDTGRRNTVAADAMKGLAAMLAHEIKNPLAGIKGAAQLAERSLPAQKKHLTQMMQREVARLKNLVESFDVAERSIAAHASPVNVHEMLDHVIDIAQAELGTTIEWRRHFDPSLPQALGNVDALIQVFLNLFRNAGAAMRNGGEVTVSTRFKSGFWRVQNHRDRLHVPIEIEVEDTGPGISPDLLDHIFEPFVTSREGGTGLGLAIVARHIHAMNGHVAARNKSGQGASFTVHLQASD